MSRSVPRALGDSTTPASSVDIREARHALGFTIVAELVGAFTLVHDNGRTAGQVHCGFYNDLKFHSASLNKHATFSLRHRTVFASKN